MSDPVSNAEIEDVLSSIRRLVSDDNRSETRHASGESAEVGAQPDRLVLTPALRVADDDGAGEEGAGDTGEPPAEPLRLEPEDLSEQDENGGEKPEPEESAVAVDAEDSESEPDHVTSDNFMFDDADGKTGENQPPWQNPDATLYEAAEQAGADTEVEPGHEDPGNDREPVAAPTETGETGEGATEDVESSVSADDDEAPVAMFFRSSRDEGYEEDQAPVEWQAPPLEMDHPAGPETDADPVEEGPSDPVTLSAKIEALEAAIARRKDQWEPDGVSADDNNAAPMEPLQWEDHVAEDAAPAPHDPEAPPQETAPEQSATEPEPALEVGTAAPEPEDGPDLPSLEETVIDEESLRELVADIVREELQGALGERITRNVRKLVRREIHRALTAQELD